MTSTESEKNYGSEQRRAISQSCFQFQAKNKTRKIALRGVVGSASDRFSVIFFFFWRKEIRVKHLNLPKNHFFSSNFGGGTLLSQDLGWVKDSKFKAQITRIIQNQFHGMQIIVTLGLYLEFSAKQRIWQVPTCKMEPQSGYIMQLEPPTHPTTRPTAQFEISSSLQEWAHLTYLT